MSKRSYCYFFFFQSQSFLLILEDFLESLKGKIDPLVFVKTHPIYIAWSYLKLGNELLCIDLKIDS